MARRSRLWCLLPILVFIALRALSHAHPAPPPWAAGLFDAEGLDDILQTIRIAYAQGADVRHLPTRVLTTPTDRISVAEPVPVPGTFLSNDQPRGPPSR